MHITDLYFGSYIVEVDARFEILHISGHVNIYVSRDVSRN